jgi:hypothetical protein
MAKIINDNPIIQKFISNKGLARFLKIATFPIAGSVNEGDPSLMCDYLLNNSTNSISSVYFDDQTGGISYTTSTNSYVMVNPLTNSSPAIQSSSALVLPGQDINLPIFQSIFYSVPLGFWFISINKPAFQSTEYTYDLYYNPVPRPEFIRYYNSNVQYATGFLNSYCADSTMNASNEPGATNIALDPVCRCFNFNVSNYASSNATINTEDLPCINGLLQGSANTSTIIRTLSKANNPTAAGELNTILKTCGCINPSCKNNHPIFMSYAKSNLSDSGTSQSGVNTICTGNKSVSICNVSLNSKDLTANIQQACGGNSVDCEGKWMDTTTCDNSGFLKQSYTVTTQPVGGGNLCSRNTGDTQLGTTVCKPPKSTPTSSSTSSTSSSSSGPVIISIIVTLILVIALVAAIIFYSRKSISAKK